jgi:hypothetical protein
MLRLPRNWQRACAGGSAVALVRGIAHAADRIECSSALIWASLRLWEATSRSSYPFGLERVSALCWHVGRLRYRFIPEMDDPTLRSFLQMKRNLRRDFFIVPVQSDYMFYLAASAELGKRRPSIFSVDSFLTWRVFGASIDAGRSVKQINWELLSHYNRCIAEVGRNDLMIGNLPNRLSLSRPRQGKGHGA